MMSYKSFTWFQIISLVLCFVSAFFADWTTGNVALACASYFAMFMIGVSMMMHRFWSHRSFEFKWKWLEWVCTGVAIIATRGSPLAWVHIHREHHSHADTEKDPHAPSTFKLFSFKSAKIAEFKPFVVREMLKVEHHVLLHEKYWYFAAIFPILLLLGGFNLFFFGYLLPVVVLQVVQDLWNYFSHVDGYTNFELKNNSKNVFWLWPLIGGEAWHNNHHASSKVWSTSFKWWEFDPVGRVIFWIKK